MVDNGGAPLGPSNRDGLREQFELEMRAIRESMRLQFKALDALLAERSITQATALSVALEGINDKIIQLNHWRDSTVGQGTFTAEIGSIQRNIEERRLRLEVIEQWRAGLAGEHTALKQTVENHNTQITELVAWKANLNGRMWAFGVIVTFISTLISIAVTFFHLHG